MKTPGNPPIRRLAHARLPLIWKNMLQRQIPPDRAEGRTPGRTPKKPKQDAPAKEEEKPAPDVVTPPPNIGSRVSEEQEQEDAKKRKKKPYPPPDEPQQWPVMGR